jgi:hypothetical protein
VVIERRAREVRGAVVCAKEIRGEAVYATDLGRKIEYKYWLGMRRLRLTSYNQYLVWAVWFNIAGLYGQHK